ncbi:MAG: type II toxin-antitoxin system VapB family antitoxin [Bryobacteraceae bacterium]|nr:type II toxin-antitoxin system VapB family antitoxin [Bryobacteraceae bacterium]
MALSIRNPEAEAMAREIAELTGESLNSAVTEALRNRLRELKDNQADQEKLLDELMEIAHRCASLPVRSQEPEDQTLGYDRWGIPENPSGIQHGH